jgi:hypothetical protein
MVQGYPCKCQRNISGLQNQAVSIQSEPDTDLDKDSNLAVTFDSLKPDLEKEDMIWESDSEDSDIEEQSEWEELDNEDLYKTMVKMAMKEEQMDGDWIPRTLRKKQDIKKGVDAHTGTWANLSIT